MPSFDFRSLFTTRPERQLVSGLGASSEWRIKPTTFAEDDQEQRFPAFQQAWKQGAGLNDLFGPNPFELHGTVAPSGGDNHRPDVAKVQTLLGKAGYVDIREGGPNGYTSDMLDSAIRQFQQDQGLKVDGVLKPHGPTITALGGLLGDVAQPQAKPAPQKGLSGEFDGGSNSIAPGEWDWMDKNQLGRLAPLGGWPLPGRDPLPEPPTTVQRRPEGEAGVPVSRIMAPTPSPEQQAEYQAAYQKWVQDNWDTIQKNKELKAMGLPPLPVPAPPRDPRERDRDIMHLAPNTKAPSTLDPQAEVKRWADWSREGTRKKDQDILSRLVQRKPADPYPDHTISEDGAFEHDKYAETLVRDSNPHETARYLKNVISWNGDAGRGDVADLLGRFAKIDEARARALQDALHQASGERIPFRVAPLAKDAGGPMADLAEGERPPPAPANPFGSAEGADRWEAGNMARALLGKSDYRDAITHFQGEIAKDRGKAMPYLAAVHQEMAAKNPEQAGTFAMQMSEAGLTDKQDDFPDDGKIHIRLGPPNLPPEEEQKRANGGGSGNDRPSGISGQAPEGTVRGSGTKDDPWVSGGGTKVWRDGDGAWQIGDVQPSGTGRDDGTVVGVELPSGPKKPELDPRFGNEQVPPPWKKDVLDKQAGAWETFNGSVNKLPGVTDAEKFVYGQLFAAEGGNDVDKKSGASSGITHDVLAEAKASGKIPGLDKVTSPKDLNADQRAAIMQSYFDQRFRHVGGAKMLDWVGDKVAAGALADTLYRHGASGGMKMVQQAINRVSGRGVVDEDGGMGPKTFNEFQRLVNDPKTRDQLLNRIADLRNRELQGAEKDRTDHYRPR